MPHYIGLVTRHTVFAEHTSVGVIVRWWDGNSAEEEFNADVPYGLTPAEFNAKVIEQVTLFRPLGEGDTFILLGGAVE